MLYLIVPPIIIVASLVVLIIFLSKRIYNFPERESFSERVNIEIEKENETSDFVDEKVEDKLIETGKSFKLKIEGVFVRLQEAILKVVNIGKNKLEKIRKEREEKKKEKELEQEKLRVEMLRREEEVEKRRLEIEEEKKRKMETERVATEKEELVFEKKDRIAEMKERMEMLRKMKKEKEITVEIETKKESKEKEIDKINKKNKLEEALIERISANPKDADAYEKLGDYYAETNQYNEAKECYEYVLKINPSNFKARIKSRRLRKFID